MSTHSIPNDPAISATPLAKAAAGLDRCVHCGFCLQACPTYIALEDENDSPRGRLLLMRGVIEGALSIEDASVATHLDRCLGCRGCESACPSGVPFGHLLEAARETMIARRPLGWMARTMLAVFASPVLSALALGGARVIRATGLARLLSRMPGRLGFGFAMLATTERRDRPRDYRAVGSGQRGRVGVLQGCVMRGLFVETNRATERTLVVNDYGVTPVPGQGCCGALHLHAGNAAAARSLARANIAAFERANVEFVAVNASGCGAAMKEYAALLDDDTQWRERARAFAARVRDVSELLADAGPVAGAPLALTVTYDAPCHLIHAQRVSAPPLAVLAAIPGLTMIPLEDADKCCGSAGIYNMIQPDVSDAVLAPKLAHISNTGATIVATGNPGCLMQIGAGLIRRGAPITVGHPVDLLDASYAALPNVAAR